MQSVLFLFDWQTAFVVNDTDRCDCDCQIMKNKLHNSTVSSTTPAVTEPSEPAEIVHQVQLPVHVNVQNVVRIRFHHVVNSVNDL